MTAWLPKDRTLLLLISGLVFWHTPTVHGQSASKDDLRSLCARVGNDDTIRKYASSMRTSTMRAFKTLFPNGTRKPDDAYFRSTAMFRCMNGKALVCFIGANLPCGKMNTSRVNSGASAFCRNNANAEFVPAYATGHNTIYSYRCRNGKAEIESQVWELDSRGFAKSLWTALSDK